MYEIIALMGESGSGKDTLQKKILKLFPKKFHKIIRTTTRPKREKEKYGIDYYFLEKENFNIHNMIEHTSFNDWFYGTSYNSLKEDKINIGVFDPYAIRQLIANQNCHVKVIYVRVSDKERLMRQLKREKNPNVKEIVRRANADFNDFAQIDFDYLNIKNNSPIDLLVAPWKILLGKFD